MISTHLNTSTSAIVIDVCENTSVHQLPADMTSISSSGPGCSARQVPAQRQLDTCIATDSLLSGFPEHTNSISFMTSCLPDISDPVTAITLLVVSVPKTAIVHCDDDDDNKELVAV